VRYSVGEHAINMAGMPESFNVLVNRRSGIDIRT
jgi:hypothetical protein